MNALLRNLIAKLSNKDFPGFGEGDGYIAQRTGEKAHAGAGAQGPARRQKHQRHQDRAGQTAGRTGASAQRRRQARAARPGPPPGRAQGTHRRCCTKNWNRCFSSFPNSIPRSSRASVKPARPWAARRAVSASSIRAARCRRSARHWNVWRKSQQQMQQSMQQMAQRGQLGNMPMTRLFRQGRPFMPFGSLTPLPGMPQFPEFDYRKRLHRSGHGKVPLARQGRIQGAAQFPRRNSRLAQAGRPAADERADRALFQKSLRVISA